MPLWIYGDFYNEKLTRNVIIILRKAAETALPADTTPTPAPDGTGQEDLLSSKLKVSADFTHYGLKEEENRDYAEIVLLMDDSPLNNASVEIFSFKKGEKPPLSEIIDGSFNEGTVLEERVIRAFYGAGKVPLLGEFPEVFLL